MACFSALCLNGATSCAEHVSSSWPINLMMACYAFYSVHLTGRIITSFASYFTDLFVRVFAPAAQRRASPLAVVLSWNWPLVQSTASEAYRPHWFCEPTTPLAEASVVWVSATDAAGGRFRSPGSTLSASLAFLQSLDRPTLAAPSQRDSTSHELSRPSALAAHRIHY
jgi:hypothetical protein